MALLALVLLPILGYVWCLIMEPRLAGQVALDIFIGLAVINFIVYMVRLVLKRKEEARRAKIAREAERADAKKLQEELRQEANQIVSTTQSLCQEINRQAWAADAALDQAEVEFTERAFAPYWDAVEVSANSLARIDEAVREIAKAGEQYITVARHLDSPPPAFVIDTSGVPDITGIARRMHGIVRPAQKDYEFASIFEKRKTNEILVSGFGTLALAIAEMADRLDRTFSGLDRMLKEMSGKPL